MFKHNLNPLYIPESSVTPPAGNTGVKDGMSKEDIVDYLHSDDDDEVEVIPLEPKIKTKVKDDPIVEPKTKVKDESEDDDEEDDESDDELEKEDEEIDELKELEQELDGPTDEQLELITPVRRSEILKKYPNVFKEFPYLEKAYYREQQFTELFSTPAEAKEAAEKSSVLDKFEADIIDGNTERILNAAKDNPKGFNKLVDNYLPTLAKVDKNAFLHVTGNVVKQTIMEMVSEAKTSNNEALGMAAQILNQFVFGSSKFEAPKPLSEPARAEDNSREESLTKREREWQRNRFTEANSTLGTKVNNSFRATIEAHIDPNQTMTEYTRKNAIRDAQEQLEKLISKDIRFKTIVDKLWEHAIKDNFSKDSMDKIRSAFMSKGKTLLLPVIKAARQEALRGMGKRTTKSDNSDDIKTPKKEGQPQSHARGNNTSKTSVPAEMSSLEFLMQDND